MVGSPSVATARVLLSCFPMKVTFRGDHLESGMLEATMGHPLWRHIQRLNQIRHAMPALQRAPMNQLNELGSGMT